LSLCAGRNQQTIQYHAITKTKTSMASHKRAKVLMVGPVSGRLRLLSDKIRSLQESKAGPFDVCLCAGPFFYQTTKASVAASAAVFEKEAEAGTGKIKVGGAGEKASEEGSSQNMEHQAAAIKDGNDLVDGSLLFDVPVLFVDVGDGLPAGIKVDDNSFVDAMNNDENEVDLDEEDEMEQGDDEINLDDAEEDMEDGSSKKNDDNEGEGIPPRTRKGLRRIAQNLYQLVGDSPQQGLLDSVADIVNVSLPLIDSQSTTSDYDADSKCREAGTSLTIGFLGPKIRMPCKGFEEKSRNTSFLGCDVLLSGEWGRGISSATCGAFSANDQIAIMASGRSTATGGVGGESLEAGSYHVANLVALSRPRYHVAPGPTVPIHLGLDTTPRHRFVSSRPYRYPVTSSGPSEGGSHVGRFLAMGSVLSPSELKASGKAYKFVHAVGILPLSDMDDHDRESAKELNSLVDFPYTSSSFGIDMQLQSKTRTCKKRGGDGKKGGKIRKKASKPHKGFTDRQKLNILEEIDRKIDNQTIICEKYGASRQSLWNWRVKREALEKAVVEENRGMKKKLIADPIERIKIELLKFYDLNEQVHNAPKLPITVSVISLKAKAIQQKLEESHAESPFLNEKEIQAFAKFKACESWASKFARESGWKLNAVNPRRSLNSDKLLKYASDTSCNSPNFDML